MGLFSDPKCPRCGRRGRHTRCAREDRKHEDQLRARGVSNPRPHPCPKCGRTVRGGVCPGPNC